jgi:integrase
VDASTQPLARLPSAPSPLADLLPELEHEHARRFADAATAPATRTAYAREWADFSAWCSSKQRAALPATLAAYISALAVGATTRRDGRPRAPRKAAGIDLALTAIAAAHKAAGLDSPRAAAGVRAVRRGIRRELGTAPLLTPELRRALAALPATLHGARDRALLLVGWAGAFRRSALVSLNVADLAFSSVEASR